MPREESKRALAGGTGGNDSAALLLHEAVGIREPSRIDLLPPTGPKPGDLLSDRFVVERVAGSGGMGVVHRGTDLFTREAVAIKVMAQLGPDYANRFAREAAVLADLRHPAIVRYVAHGTTPQATPFLAMEWLDGEDLSMRLARSPLTVEESLSLMRRACEGIAVAHARGVVHRDIKPSNIFLLDADPSSVKVIDFGIARQNEGTQTLTQSGALLGTVGYMSPEQAMAAHNVDARADVFALGCVMFECLTGRAAFGGPNPLAVWAKVLREEPPRVRELRAELGEGLDALVARMLAKSVDERPKDAAAIILALDEIGLPARRGSPLRPSIGLTGSEQKIVSVILGRPLHDARRSSEPVTLEQVDAEVGRIHELTSLSGAEPVVLPGGAVLVVVSGRGAATDQADRAAKSALLLRRLRPDLSLVVATGRAETTGRIPVGAAIDRAAALFPSVDCANKGIAIDELTAGLLDPAFDVRREGTSYELLGQRTDFEATRLLMGKPTPFVGRDREIALLDLTLRECIDESAPRAVLITGPAGQGKSRLRHEFVATVRRRGDVGILVAKAGPVGAGSSFTLVRQLVRHATGVREGDSAAGQDATLRAHVIQVCKEVDFARIADFLGELIGIPSREHSSPQFRAARNDPQIMGMWLRRSFGEWLMAECAARPLLLILEDLHWGDLPSVTYLDEALRLATSSLMVLALARPEVHEALPSLWTEANKTEVTLGRLSARASERIVREALGEMLPADVASRIIERAGGNVFYLEELIRRVADGDDHGLPETVLALAQSRLERLEPDVRRVVRAASIFGEAFWSGGLAAVLGTAASKGDLDACLRTLVERELLAPAHANRFPGEIAYTFRHSLLREAAYAMLTERDLATGHGLAGAWLESVGERDALILADHFERAGVSARAVPWLLDAARTALHGGNLDAAFALAQRGVDCRPADADLGLLLGTQALVLSARGEWAHSVDLLRRSMPLLQIGSKQWITSAAGFFLAGISLGDPNISAPILTALLDPRRSSRSRRGHTVAPFTMFASGWCRFPNSRLHSPFSSAPNRPTRARSRACSKSTQPSSPVCAWHVGTCIASRGNSALPWQFWQRPASWRIALETRSDERLRAYVRSRPSSKWGTWNGRKPALARCLPSARPLVPGCSQTGPRTSWRGAN